MPLEKISLLLQSSSGHLTVGLVQDGRIIFESCEHPSLSSSRNVRDHLLVASNSVENLAKRVDRIYVDIGPGGLGATRSAVAFANALAFANGIDVYGLHAFELIGRHFQEYAEKPVVCIRNAARPNYYLGIYDGGELSHCSLASKEDVMATIEEYRSFASFAGRFFLGEGDVCSGFDIPASLGNHASMSTFLSAINSKEFVPAPLRRVLPITGPLEENLV